MLLSEALLLLLLDEDKGSSVLSGWAHDEGLAGALLLDLLAAGAIEERDSGLVAVGTEPAASPALAAAWRSIGAESRGVRGWVRRLPKRLKPIKGAVAERLVATGVLDEQRHKRLGLFGVTRFPELDAGPERSLRATLRSVLVTGVEPDDFTASLLGLLVPMELVGRLVERPDRAAAKSRAKALAERGAVGDAVRKAVQQEIAAAVLVAATAATAGGASG